MSRRFQTGASSLLDSTTELRDKAVVEDNALLQRRVQELEVLLREAKANSAVQKIPLNQIRVNPKQPRKSFYVVAQKIQSLKNDGQKTPIILTKPPGETLLLVFDGECRLRAARELGWATIDAIVIPYNPQTFEVDVLISAIQDNGLNSLDLAAAIVEQIQKKLPNLTFKGISRILNTALARLRYQKKQNLLRGLEKKNFEEIQRILNQLNLKPEDELVIFSTILSFRLNLFLVSNTKLPFLKLNQDVQDAIRLGLGESQAKIIDQIKKGSKKYNIEEIQAKALRQDIAAKTIAENLSVSEVKKLVADLTATYINPESLVAAGDKRVKQLQGKIEKLDTSSLNQNQRELVIESLRQKIITIERE